MVTHLHSTSARVSERHAAAIAAPAALALFLFSAPAAIAAPAALALLLLSVPAAQATDTHQGFVTADRVFDWDRDQPSYGSQRPGWGNSWYGPGRDENVAGWAIGTFRGQNGGNGVEETITIRPDGSVELRTRDNAPRYGTFAGETLTIGSRMSRVQPARGGIVVDGAYYYR